MSDHNESPEQAIDVQKHVKTYVTILVSLIVMTLVTVIITQRVEAIPVRLTLAVTFALLQGFLSVSYLMHLNAERKFVIWVLVLTVVFFFALILIPLLTVSDSISTGHVS